MRVAARVHVIASDEALERARRAVAEWRTDASVVVDRAGFVDVLTPVEPTPALTAEAIAVVTRAIRTPADARLDRVLDRLDALEARLVANLAALRSEILTAVANLNPPAAPKITTDAPTVTTPIGKP